MMNVSNSSPIGRSANFQSIVAPIFNRPWQAFRSFATSAGCKPAIQQITNLRYVAIALSGCLLSGCLSRPALVKQSFNFAPPSVKTVAPAEAGRLLGIRTVEVAPAFQGRLFVYRTGDSSYERDPYAEFLVSPAESLRNAVRSHLRDGGRFQAVTEPGNLLKPDTLVEIHAGQLYGDFHDQKEAAAILSIRFVFLDAPHDTPGRILLQKTYSRRVPFKRRTAAALMAGWNEALGQILADLDADLKKRNM